MPIIYFNPLERKTNYSATSNYEVSTLAVSTVTFGKL